MLTVLEMPLWLRIPVFHVYIWSFRCRLEEAVVSDLQQYRSLSELFRRSLKPGVRPVETASELVSSIKLYVLIIIVIIYVAFLPFQLITMRINPSPNCKSQ